MLNTKIYVPMYLQGTRSFCLCWCNRDMAVTGGGLIFPLFGEINGQGPAHCAKNNVHHGEGGSMGYREGRIQAEENKAVKQ